MKAFVIAFYLCFFLALSLISGCGFLETTFGKIPAGKIGSSSSFSSMPLSSVSSSSSTSSSASNTNLVFWETFDGAADITTPKIGAGGTCLYTNFTQGYFGSAYFADHSRVNQIYFPRSIIPDKRGCIEFWGRISNMTDTNVVNNKIIFFSIFDGISVRYEVSISQSDGINGTGLCAMAGDVGDYTSSSGGATFQLSNAITGVTNWHHYALVWDVNGVMNGTNIALYLDGSLVKAGQYVTPGSLDTPTNNNVYFLENNVLPGFLLIDNMKIWNIPKTNFSDRFIEGF